MQYRREFDDRLRCDNWALRVCRRRGGGHQERPGFCAGSRQPGPQAGWMSRHGHRLGSPDSDGILRCPESGYRYQEVAPGVLRCLDLNEEAPLPAELSVGNKSYRQIKEESNYEYSAARS